MTGPGGALEKTLYTQQLGMAHRFAVTVGSYNLGNWAKASGLKVTWDKVEHRPGDVVNGVWWYPGTAKYETIKLSRAADAKNTATTASWLQKVSSKNVPESGAITLYDSHNMKVFQWTLDGIFPQSWNIGDFDASGSKVAMEQLELQHNGFLLDELKIGH